MKSFNEREFREIVQICHTCRLCILPYEICPFFPALYEVLDRKISLGEVIDVTEIDFKGLLDLCYDCKLCYLRCPMLYDIGKFMLNYMADYVAKHGHSLRNLVLSNIDIIGKLGSLIAPLANLVIKSRPSRIFMEKILGLSKKRMLPDYSRYSFPKWFRAHQIPTIRGKRGVIYFSGCFTNYYDIHVGIAAIKVLLRNGINIIHPEQQCCGAPKLATGSRSSAFKNIAFNVTSLSKFIRKGYDIVATCPSCSFMLKEYENLLSTDEARLVSEHTYDLSQYLAMLYEQNELNIDFKPISDKVAYYPSCRLKVQRLERHYSNLMKMIPNMYVIDVDDNCCGMGGIFGLKDEYFSTSMGVGKRLFEAIMKADVKRVATECPACKMQISQATGVMTVHPIEIIAEAYGITLSTL